MSGSGEPSSERWLRIVAAFIAGVLLIALIVASIASSWLAQRLAQDFWPIDASRVGPNLVASMVQWAVLAVVAVAVYPPLRHWVEGLFHSLHDKMDMHHAEGKAERFSLHDKLDHIIEHHPDLPPMPKKDAQ